MANIGFVSRYAPNDRGAWSGTNYKLLETISKSHKVTYIRYRRDYATQFFGVAVKVLARMRRKNESIDFTRFASRRMAKTIDVNQINQVDVLFFPGGSSCLASLETNKPIVYLTDATFDSLYGYYPNIDNFMEFNRRQGNAIETRALERANRVVVSSNWARDSVIDTYQQPTTKVRTIEFGANLLSETPLRVQTYKNVMGNFSKTNKLKLLFVGVDWNRKGGNIAAECCRRLNVAGILAELHVVGTAVPDKYQKADYIIQHGFLDKNKPSDFHQLNTIIASSHLLILPTQAECAGIVFCEASANGLPSITLDTGGTMNYVINEVNGYRLPANSDAEDFAQMVQKILSLKNLEMLGKGAIDIYNNRLNWNHWLDNFNDVVEDLERARVPSTPEL